MKRTMMASVAVTMLLGLAPLSPVLAQGGGDNSSVTICKTRLEKAQVDMANPKNSAKATKAADEYAAAKDAMAQGNATSCLAHLDKVDTAMK